MLTRGIGTISLVVLLAVCQVSVAGSLVEIDRVADGTTSIVGVAGPTPVYGTPITDASVGWANVAVGTQAWDLTNPVYDVVVQGRVTAADVSGGAWMTLGLLDKHYLDGLAVGQDPAIGYPSGQYGFGMNGGITIVGGPHFFDNNDLVIKLEDGWPEQGWQNNPGSAFDFKIRYSLTAGTLEGWWKFTYENDTQWDSMSAAPLTLGQPINAYYDYTGDTTTPDRYKADQWDQTLLGLMVVNDGADGAPGSITIENMTMSLDAIAGDADLDGDVDADDLATWGANYTGASGAGKLWLNGDFDGDGDVDADDLATWGANYTGTASAVSMMNAAYAAAVPEPMTMSLFALGGLAVVRRRRK